MPAVTLAEAANNAQMDYDADAIDEFRKESVILDTLPFLTAVNPSGGGDTMTYGYRRQVTQPIAAFRAINSEYTPQNVTTEKFTVDLVPLGGAFEVDRIVARIGANASGAVALNMRQKIKATNTRFSDAVINGDTAGGGDDDANGFDGLDKALVGSSTEFRPAAVTNWTAISSQDDTPHVAMDDLDEFLSLLDGPPTVVLGNTKAIAKVRGIARRAGMYTRNPVEGLFTGPNNDIPVVREMFGNIVFADPGNKAGSNDPIIPVEARTVGSPQTGLTDLYAYRVGEDGFTGVTTTDGQMIRTWMPDFTSAGAVKPGEVELGPVAVALKATKAAAVFRNIKVQ